MNNIVLVCDDEKVSKYIKSNLMLLRKLDYIYVCGFLNIETTISQNLPQLVIVYSKSGDIRTFDVINSIKNTPVLYITDEINEDYILNIFEAGINDYLTLDASQTEFLIRVMLCIKNGINNQKYERNMDILTQIGIVEKETGFYTKKYTPAVFKEIIKKSCEQDIPVVLMALAPDIDDKNKCPLEFLASITKQNLRENDIIGFHKDYLYVLLPNTNIQGGLDVYNKIKKVLESTCGISAGIVKAEKDITFDVLSKNADEALDDALSVKNSAVVQENIDSTPAMNWLDKANKKHKSFKLFKKTFLKKLEKVILPVFYQKQQMAEQRLFEAKIKQFSNDEKSQFIIKKNKICSLLEITYPGAVKINIDIYKNINDADETPERTSYDLAQVNEKMLGDILDKFIRDFQKNDKE